MKLFFFFLTLYGINLTKAKVAENVRFRKFNKYDFSFVAALYCSSVFIKVFANIVFLYFKDDLCN